MSVYYFSLSLGSLSFLSFFFQVVLNHVIHVMLFTVTSLMEWIYHEGEKFIKSCTAVSDAGDSPEKVRCKGY